MSSTAVGDVSPSAHRVTTLGVVGHVDHGKSALVRALTNIETDRLPEERARGLSIVLGFSYLDADGATIDLIDAPGHEDYVRAMISGATGFDGILLVVDANEGVMPQSREHFDIARMLGVRRGIVVITKLDLLHGGDCANVRRQIAELARGTFLETAPVIETSARTGEGIERLRQAVVELARVPVERPDSGGFYLPLDRVFAMHGFGVVGTGTLRGRELKSGQTVEIMPAGRRAAVRGLQRHGRPVESARPGQRVAVNLRNVDLGSVARGDALATPGWLASTNRLDARVELLQSARPLRNGVRVRVLLGTSETIARLRLLDKRELAPGDSAFVQLRCDRAVATRSAERLLIRSLSPMRTIGGGRIVAVDSPRLKRFDGATIAKLQALADRDPIQRVRQSLADSGGLGIDLEELCAKVDLPEAEVRGIVAALDAVWVGISRVIARQTFALLSAEVTAAIQQYHRENPLKLGLALGSLQHRLAAQPAEDVVRCIVRILADRDIIRVDGELLQHTDFDPLGGLTGAVRTAARRVERLLLDAQLTPPPAQQLSLDGEAAREAIAFLIEHGRIVKLRNYARTDSLVLHVDCLNDAKTRIAQCYPYPARFTVKEVRDLLGATRKYIVPLLEHLDASGFTLRHGDHRQLRPRSP